MPGAICTRIKTLWYQASRRAIVDAVSESSVQPNVRPKTSATSATSAISATSATSATTAAPVVRHDHPTPVLGALGLFTVLLGAALP